MIETSAGTNKVIDIPNNNCSNKIKPIIYNKHFNGNQRFILRNQFSQNRKNYFTIFLLNNQTKCLLINDDNICEIGTESNGFDNQNSHGNDLLFWRTKFIIESAPYGFLIRMANSTLNKYLVPNDFNNLNNSTLKISTLQDPYNNRLAQWKFIKTDSLGLNVHNKVALNGTNIKHFNLRVPLSMDYII